MRITEIETFTVGAGWKNWLFVKVHTDAGIYGIGEGTLNGFIATTEAGVHELKHLAIGQDPRRINSLAKRMLDSVSLDGGHIHRTVIAAVEVACWDILGKSLGVPIHQLLGGQVRESELGYANGWYRTERTPESFLEAAKAVLAKGFRAFKLDPFGTAQGFISHEELELSYDICRMLRDKLPRDTRILIDVHARFTEIAAIKSAERFANLDIYWWEEPTSRDRQETVHEVARRSPIPVATGEMYDTVGQFYALAAGGGVNIFQPEPMSLGGIGPSMQVANLALAHGSYIAPHQSGGPVATAVCLQLAAAVPNFLIQEHFDAFNEEWTFDIVTWRPKVNPKNGHLSLPDAPGLGVDLNLDAITQHPYDPNAYLNTNTEGWEQRLGTVQNKARTKKG
ncbi:mandelate racemase/muconate lactonizing enzyme family protein [Devosia sp.]|jgi:galactonate dehydratase|uniref:mandelate racemase/muconate lactonizing enzyme family protein n=1 Tax=Devosia sp. TaxID=1871048 RepID=UPI0037C091DA